MAKNICIISINNIIIECKKFAKTTVLHVLRILYSNVTKFVHLQKKSME